MAYLRKALSVSMISPSATRICMPLNPSADICMRVCVFVYVCMSALRVLIINGVMWRGMMWTPYDWLNKLYSCYMATEVSIINGYGLGIDTYQGN